MEWPAAVADTDTAQLSITEFKPGRLREIGEPLEDTLRLAARAAFALGHSVATITAERLGAIRRAEALASAAVAFMAVVASMAAVAVTVVAAGVIDIDIDIRH